MVSLDETFALVTPRDIYPANIIRKVHAVSIIHVGFQFRAVWARAVAVGIAKELLVVGRRFGVCGRGAGVVDNILRLGWQREEEEKQKREEPESNVAILRTSCGVEEHTRRRKCLKDLHVML